MADSSNVRAALAQRVQSQQVDRPGPPAEVSPATMVRQAIEKQSAGFRTVLPSVVDPDRFSRLVLTAVRAAPELMRCFETKQGQTSVLLAAMQAATIGLEPNTATQHCWLLPRRNQGTWECQLSIGYRGYMTLARRSGTIETIFAEVVYAADEFRWGRGLTEDVLEHVPFEGPAEERGDLTHAYAVARYRGGGYSFIVLNRADVESRRAMSDSWKNAKSRPYSPWTKWPAAMWRKSAVRALVPFMELSADVEQAISSDEAKLAWDDETSGVGVLAPDFSPPELDVPDDVTESSEEGAGEPHSPSVSGEPPAPVETAPSSGEPPAPPVPPEDPPTPEVEVAQPVSDETKKLAKAAKEKLRTKLGQTKAAARLDAEDISQRETTWSEQQALRIIEIAEAEG